MATRVSCGFAEITISFDIETPHGASDGGGTQERAHAARVAQGTALYLPRTAAREKPVALLDCSAHPMRLSFQIKSPAGKRFAARALKSCWVQLTNRRMRTFITRPKDINTNAVADPP
jgi:hypothetical protein